MKLQRFIFIAIIVIIITFCGNITKNSANAQQNIINIPSSEVLPAGDLIFKQSNRITPLNDNRIMVKPTLTMGLGHGLVFSGAVGITPSDESLVRGDFGLKKVIYLGGATRFTLGSHISPYYSEKSTPDTFFYSHFSHRIKETKTSLTAGAYIGGQQSMPNTAGILLGLEQVLIPNKLRLALDWCSGENNYGRMGVGLKYRPISTLSLTTAVILPNDKSDNIAFNVSLSKFISLKDTNILKRRDSDVD